MALCEICSKITLKELQAPLPYYAHLPLEDLRLSAKTCKLCDLLLTALCKAHIAEFRLEDEPQAFKEQGKSLTPLYPLPTQLRLSTNKIAKGYISETSAISQEPDHRITELAAPDFDFVAAVAFDGYPALRLDADLSSAIVSRTPNTGRLPQRPPIVYSKDGGMETLADVAHRHNLGTINDPEPLRALGYGLLQLVGDPQIDENTPVRFVVDKSMNPIGWAAMDEDEHEAFRATLEPGKEVLDTRLQTFISV
ncbi:hypothetical protein NEMBOFW57_000351 [Staphylotrichum longicolle]|uniref:Uncharacterized protein n=1 Tax=Staphylotrichum longicolle TaxID=669026 RepID=A0AAD4EZ76_9PEZI|nr:hypothetical protein NEMBOFW57_000351 [Staphylotrichum longicolle]